MSLKRFAISTLLLMIAGLIVRVLGFVYRIFLSNTIGPEGIGLYQLVTPLYSLIVLTLTSGISITGSRMISARFNRNRKYNPNKIVAAGLSLACAGGSIASLLMLIFADVIANYIIGDPRTLISIKILIPCIPVVAAAAAFKGYYYGIQRVGPAALASIIEQVTRIGVVAALAATARGMGIEYVCAVAVAAAAIGELANLVVLFLAYPLYTKKSNKPKRIKKEKFKSLVGEMYRGTVPISLNRLIISVVGAIETVMIPQFLAFGGLPYKLALEEFGRMAGMAMPLIYFPSVVTSSLSTSLVAEISGNMATGRKNTVNSRISKSIGITLMMGMFFCSIFLSMPDSIGNLAFKGMEVGKMLRVLGYSAMFLYLQQTLMGVLNGLGRQSQVLTNTMIGYGIRILFICFAVPKIGITGYAAGIFFSEILVCYLCLKDISKVTKLKWDVMNWFLKPLVAVLALWCLTPFITEFISSHFGTGRFGAVAAVGACYITYLALLLMLGMGKYYIVKPIRKELLFLKR